MDKIKASQFADLAYYCRTPLLPAAYQQVEYIQSSGTQYLNIGSFSNHAYFDFTFTWVSFLENDLGSGGNVNGLVGCNGYGNNDVKIWLRRTNQISYIANGVNVGNASVTIGTKYHVYASPSQFTVDGQDYTSQTTTTSSTTPCSIFSVYYFGGEMYKRSCAIKLYHFKTSSIDLYPCVRKSDSKTGMFDVVSKTFYANSGTGEFAVGGNV